MNMIAWIYNLNLWVVFSQTSVGRHSYAYINFSKESDITRYFWSIKFGYIIEISWLYSTIYINMWLCWIFRIHASCEFSCVRKYVLWKATCIVVIVLMIIINHFVVFILHMFWWAIWTTIDVNMCILIIT